MQHIFIPTLNHHVTLPRPKQALFAPCTKPSLARSAHGFVVHTGCEISCRIAILALAWCTPIMPRRGSHPGTGHGLLE